MATTLPPSPSPSTRLALAEAANDASSVPGTQTTENRKLAIRIGADAFLLDVLGAGEIVPVPAITPVPWTQPWYRGLANVRGRLVGVIDLQHLGGGAPLGPDQAGQLVVLHPSLRYNVGLLASRAFGLRSRIDLTGPEEVRDAARPWETAVWHDADGIRMTEIDLRRLMDWGPFVDIGI